MQYSRTNKDNKPTKQYRFNCDCQSIKTINEIYLDDMIVYALRECIFSSINTDELLTRLNEYAELQNKDNQLQIDVLTAEKKELKHNQDNLISLIEKGVSTDAVCERLKEIETQIQTIDDKITKLFLTKKTFIADDLKTIKSEFVRYVMEECNENTVTMLNDTIKEVKVGDTIIINFNDGIKVNRDTKKIFN